MSYGVVPAASSLMGANGYLNGHHPLGGEGEAHVEAGERLALLQQTHNEASASRLAAPPAAASGASDRLYLHGSSGASAASAATSSSKERRPSGGLQGGSEEIDATSPSGRQQGPWGSPPPKSSAAPPGAAPMRSCHYESLDYDVVENAVYRADQANQTDLETVQASAAKWGMCFVLGVITAAAAFAVNFGVENISGFKFWLVLSLMEQGGMFASFLVYLALNVGLVAAAACLTVYWAPAAAGSGIPEVKAYLNGINIPGILLPATLAAKMLGMLLAVSGGLASGKEGPFVHAGAAFGALLCQGGSATTHLPWFTRFWNDRDRSDMVACGAAAGVAAAFRSPLGGVLFALEEMTSWWRNQLLWFAFFTTAVVSVAVRVMMSLCGGGAGAAQRGCGFFGAGGFIVYEITEGQVAYEFSELLPVLLLGVIGGLVGSCFNYLHVALVVWRKRALAPWGPRGRVVEAVVVAALVSGVSFFLPLMVECQPCPPDAREPCPRIDNSHSGNFVSFGCGGAEGGKYNDLATLFFNTQDDAIRALFSARTNAEYSVTSLLIFAAVFYGLALLCYGLTVPTGLFVPSILCGAAYGRLVGIFVAAMHPSHAVDEGTYALLGAASFLGGSMRLTVCTCVMLLELTNNLALLPMVMLVLLVAKAVGDGTGVKPIYEAVMEAKTLPYLEPQPDGLMCHITAREAAGQPAVCFARVERVGRLLEALRATSHSGFPVLAASHHGAGGPEAGGERHIMGVVLRSQLVVLLSTRRAFQPSPYVSEAASRVAFSYPVSAFAVPVSEPPPDVGGIQLTPEQASMYLDLGPYVNPSCYVVQEDTSLAKAYTLFRTLGLRHLCVVPRATEVSGIISRADLLSGQLEERFLDARLPRGAGVAGLAGAIRHAAGGGASVRDALDALAMSGGGASTSSGGAHGLRVRAAAATAGGGEAEMPPLLGSLGRRSSRSPPRTMLGVRRGVPPGRGSASADSAAAGSGEGEADALLEAGGDEGAGLTGQLSRRSAMRSLLGSGGSGGRGTHLGRR